MADLEAYLTGRRSVLDVPSPLALYSVASEAGRLANSAVDVKVGEERGARGARLAAACVHPAKTAHLGEVGLGVGVKA